MASCFPILSVDYFSNLIAKINAIGTPAELQALIDEEFGGLSLLVSTITSQLAFLGPIEALITAPVNPAEVITWIGNFITGFLTPYIKPLVTMEAQLTEITAEVASLTAAIESVAALKFPGVTITIPSVGAICTL